MKRCLSRRRFLEAGVLVGVAGAGARNSTAAATRQSGDSWPMYNYDAANSSHAPSGTGPTEGPERRWSVQARETRESSAVVADGTAYITSREGTVHAIGAGDGNLRWSVEIPGETYSSPAVADGTVYATDEDAVSALAAADGSEEWRFTAGRGVYWSPAVVDGTVYVTAIEGHVYALDADDGSEQWVTQREGPVLSAPAVAGDAVYFCGDDGIVWALNASDGSERWTADIGGQTRASPAVVGETLYIGNEDGRIHALDASDGSERWTVETGDAVRSVPAVANGTVYAGSLDETVYAIDASDGTERWTYRAENQVGTSPAVVGGTVYGASTDGTVYALDAGDGAERWTVQAGDALPPMTAVAVVNSTVYVRTEDGSLHAFSDRPAPTPSPTATATETPTDAPAAGNSPTAAVNDVSGSRQRGLLTTVQRDPGMSLLFGGGVLAAGLLAAQKYRKTAGAGATASDPGESAADLWDEAERALSAANEAESNADYGTAIEEYDRGIRACESALGRLPDDDERHGEIAAVLEKARQRREKVQDQHETRAAFRDALETAESHFQTAVAAPASDRVVIPRERYRQARNAYDEALELLDDADEDLVGDGVSVSPEPTVEAPPENLAQFPGVHSGAQAELADRGLGTLSAIRDADGETLDELRDHDAIGRRLAVRLAGLNRWHGGDEVEFPDRDAVERRRDLADEAYEAHRR